MTIRNEVLTVRRQTALIIATLAGAIVMLVPPPEGLSPAAMRAFGLLVWAIICWATNALPDYVTAMFMALGWVVLKVVPLQTAFSSFSSSGVWMMFGALGIGVAVAESGLLRRVVLLMLRALPPTFAGQMAGLIGAGIVLGPTLPSAVGKVAITGRFVLGMAEAMNLDDRSDHSTGLFMAMLLGFGTMQPLFMTGTITNFVILGLLPAEAKAGITWGSWFVTYLPTMLIILALSALAIYVVCRPKQVVPLSRSYLDGELAAIGPLSRHERITLAVLGITLALWVTGQWHGIDATAVGFGAVAVLCALGLIDRPSFQARIAWSSLMFMGITLNLATVFRYLTIDVWLGTKITPIFAPLLDRPILFFPALMLVVVLIRQVLVSWDATITIMLLILTPAVATVGINPWAVAIASHLAAQACWFLPFQNGTYLVAHQASDGRLANQAKATLLSAVSIIIALFAVTATLPWWQLRGLLPR